MNLLISPRIANRIINFIYEASLNINIKATGPILVHDEKLAKTVKVIRLKIEYYDCDKEIMDLILEDCSDFSKRVRQ